jgi:hypothetical protein
MWLSKNIRENKILILYMFLTDKKLCMVLSLQHIELHAQTFDKYIVFPVFLDN